MSYTPTNWSSGDIVTAEKLNKIEQGIAEALSSEASDIPEQTSSGQTLLVVHINNHTMDKTFGEIKDTLEQGGAIKFYCMDYEPYEERLMQKFYEQQKKIILSGYNDDLFFAAGSDDDYPFLTEEQVTT